MPEQKQDDRCDSAVRHLAAVTHAWHPCRLPELRRTASWSTRDAYTDGHVTAGLGAEGGGLRTRAATSRAHGFRRFHPGATGVPRCSSQGDICDAARARPRSASSCFLQWGAGFSFCSGRPACRAAAARATSATPRGRAPAHASSRTPAVPSVQPRYPSKVQRDATPQVRTSGLARLCADTEHCPSTASTQPGRPMLRRRRRRAAHMRCPASRCAHVSD